VLGDIGQQLGDTKIGDRLDRRCRPVFHGEAEIGPDRAARRQGGKGPFETDIEGGRVDAAGDVAKLNDGRLGTAVSLVHELGDLLEVDLCGIGQLFFQKPEPHGDRDELGLSAVVQVPLDTPQHRGRRVEGLGAGTFQRAHPDRDRIGTEQGPHQVTVERDDAPHGPGGREQQDGACQKDGKAVQPPRRAD
jgi:hypothetical protein